MARRRSRLDETKVYKCAPDWVAGRASTAWCLDSELRGCGWVEWDKGAIMTYEQTRRASLPITGALVAVGELIYSVE